MNEDKRLLNHMALHCDNTIEWIQSCIDDPKWENCGKVHNWRNYIPQYLQNIWNSLSQETRAVSVAIAEELANKEEWE